MAEQDVFLAPALINNVPLHCTVYTHTHTLSQLHIRYTGILFAQLSGKRK